MTLKQNRLKKYIPILDWLPRYSLSFLKGDLLAGLTVGIILIPQGIAYALIAGLPPIYGLYTALIPQFIYTLFGTSRQLATGPIAIDSLIIAAGISAIASVSPDQYIAVVFALTLMTGCIQIIVGIFKLGFIVNFLSKPVLTGFITAAALIIGFNQFKALLKLDIERTNRIQNLLYDLFANLQQIHLKSLLIGGVAILLIYSLRKVNKRIPGPLIAVVLGILVMKFFSDQFSGVEIVKEIPKGLPSFSLPVLNYELFYQLIPLALTLAFTGFLQAISIAKALEEEDKQPVLRSNQELIALGMSNLIGSCMNSYTSSGSFARSALNKEMGAHTPMANAFAALFIGVTLLFLTPVFYYLPNTVLAAIIIVAVFSLIKLDEIRFLWSTNRQDFAMMLVTFIITLTIGVKEGIIVGVLVSIFMVIFDSSKPHMAVLGKVPGSANFYRNIARFNDVEEYEELLIVRFDARLYFANANYFKEQIDRFATKKGSNLKAIILDAEVINNIDSTGAAILGALKDHYQNKNIRLFITNVKGPVRDAMAKSGLTQKVGSEHFFMSIQAAVDAYFSEVQGVKKFTKYVNQTNIEP